MFDQLIQSISEKRDPEATEVDRMIQECKFNALEKALPLVRKAKGLGLENPAKDNIWDSIGMSKERFAELAALAKAIREAAPNKSVSILSVELSEGLEIREKILIAFLMR